MGAQQAGEGRRAPKSYRRAPQVWDCRGRRQPTAITAGRRAYSSPCGGRWIAVGTSSQVEGARRGRLVPRPPGRASRAPKLWGAGAPESLPNKRPNSRRILGFSLPADERTGLGPVSSWARSGAWCGKEKKAPPGRLDDARPAPLTTTRRGQHPPAGDYRDGRQTKTVGPTRRDFYCGKPADAANAALSKIRDAGCGSPNRVSARELQSRVDAGSRSKYL